MALLNETLVDYEAEPGSEFSRLPAGDYVVSIIESDVVENSRGTGVSMTAINMVLEGPYKDSKIQSRITLTNSNSQQAQDIGQRQMAGLRYATGKLRAQATEDFHNIPVIAHVGPRKQTAADIEQYGEQTEIKSYKAIDGAQATASHQPPPSASRPPVASRAAPSASRPPVASRAAPVATFKPNPNEPAWARK